MKVVMIKSTRTADQGFFKIGDVVDIDDKTGQRWISKGIAQASKNTPTRAKRASKPVEPVRAEQASPAPQPTTYYQVDTAPEDEDTESELASKSFHDLRAMAKDLEIEDYGKMTKVELVEHISNEV